MTRSFSEQTIQIIQNELFASTIKSLWMSTKQDYQTEVNVLFVNYPSKIVNDALVLSTGPQDKKMQNLKTFISFYQKPQSTTSLYFLY